MANWAWFTKAHKKVFNLSGGRLGSSMGGQRIVMMNTIGRKSGQVRQVPVACYRYKDNVTIVASNNGLDKHPVWWLNLQHTPDIEVQLGRQIMRVRARELEGDERAEAWQALIKKNPRQKEYQAGLKHRLLPVVYLEPA